MKNTKLAIILIAILIGLATITLLAQTDETKKIEVSGGYSYTNVNHLSDLPRVANGWTIGTAYKFKKRVSIYAEGGEDYGKKSVTFLHRNDPGTDISENSAYRFSVLGGLRFHFVNKSRITPLVNFGIGLTRYSDTHRFNGSLGDSLKANSLLFAAGGGIDFALNKNKTISLRNSIEYRRIEDIRIPFTTPVIGNAFRFSTGIVFNF